MMASSGRQARLIVFEGPDGVGKSTLCELLAAELQRTERPCELFSFPGRDPGTLGRLVYEVHHDPTAHSVTGLTEASKQLLHVAAHIDSIESRIMPALQQGKWVILDRFWWSTWVYGKIGGVDERLLEAMIVVERLRWSDFLPDVVFLVARQPTVACPDNGRPILEATYRELFEEETSRHPVRLIRNDGPIGETVSEVLRELAVLSGER